MKIAFFDTKPYDVASFEKYKTNDLKFKFFVVVGKRLIGNDGLFFLRLYGNYFKGANK